MLLRHLQLMIFQVWLQFLRRNEFYVVLILMLAYLAGIQVMFATGGLGAEDSQDYVPTQQFLLSLGLSFSASFAAILTAAFAARQLPEEFENRTLYPLLAKPISRGEVLLGKFAGVLLIGVGSLLLFTAMCWLAVPRIPSQSLAMLAQILVLRSLALGVLAALAVALSVRMPAVLAGGLAMGWWFAGDTVVSFARSQAAASLGDWAGRAVEVPAALLPAFARYDYFEVFVRGGEPLGLAIFAATAAHALLTLAFLYAASHILFHRQAL